MAAAGVTSIARGYEARIASTAKANIRLLLRLLITHKDSSGIDANGEGIPGEPDNQSFRKGVTNVGMMPAFATFALGVHEQRG